MINMTFSVPVSMVEQTLAAMRALGVEKVEEDNAIHWRESEHFRSLLFPGTSLAGLRYREDLTQMELSQKTGIPRRHISEMENGKRPIGKVNARKLASALNADFRLLLSV